MMQVARTLKQTGVVPHALRLSKEGFPWHPLYLPDNTDAFEWDLAA